jgi:hypothetical protein
LFSSFSFFSQPVFWIWAFFSNFVAFGDSFVLWLLL